MNKAYSRTVWENDPSQATPIDEQHLNNIEVGLNEVDDRVVAMDTTKANQTDLLNAVKTISYEESTGKFTITYFNGGTTVLDTALEKIAVNFDYDPQTQILKLVLQDGSTINVDLSVLITQYEFVDTDTIDFTIGADGKVSAIVKEGSIQESHLAPTYLADIRAQVETATMQAADSNNSAINSENSAKISQSWAVGGTDIRNGENTNNSKYYAERAEQAMHEAEEISGGNFVKTSEKGVALGVATLDVNKKIPITQIPSIDADKLEGYSSTYFAKATDLTDTEATINGRINVIENNIKRFSGETEEVGKTITFNTDGSITENYVDSKIKTTTFNEDGSITEVTSKDGVMITTKITIFNTDGSITETVEKGEIV